MFNWQNIEPERPDTLYQWFILLLVLPAFLWIGAVLWVLDRKDYYRTLRWCRDNRVEATDNPTDVGKE